jgi:RNA polymerase sigma factor (sigma-70 family)
MAASPIRSLLPHIRGLVSGPASQTADRELLRRFGLEHDESAFAEIVRRHGPMLLRVCRRVLPSEHDAEDVCQAAFLLLARKATSIRWHDSVTGWLFQTAYRLSLKARAAAARRARHEARARQAPPPDPLAELTARELQDVLDEELSRLPEKYRAPILLCCLEGRSRDEAAACLGWPLGAMKDRLEQGRERLRARLARRGVLLGTALTSAWLLEGGTAAALSPRATAAAALRLATGQATLAGLLPARVAALVKGGTTMLFCRVTILAAAGLALALGAAAGVTRRSAGPPPAPPRAKQAKPAAKPEEARPKEEKPKQGKPAPAAVGPVQPEAVPLTGHRGAVNAVAFAPGGKAVATAGADGTVRLWDPSTGTQLHRLPLPDRAVGVAFSPDATLVVAASAGKVGAVIGWDRATGRKLWQCSVAGGVGAVAFSPDGKLVVTGCPDGSLLALHAPSGKVVRTFRGFGVGTTVAAFSPDGKSLAMGGAAGNIHQLDMATGKILRVWRGKDNITALAYFPDGARVAAADGGKALRLLHPTTGKEEAGFEGKEAVRALAFHPGGKRLATAAASGAVLLWDATGKQERQFSARGAVHALAFSPNGKRLATAGADGAVLWDLTRDEKPLPKDFKLTEKDLKALWADLASDEGGKVYGALRLLRADPARAVPFLQERLKPKAKAADQKKLERLIAELDSDEFKKREEATNELEKLGGQAESALRKALAGKPSLEVRLRVQRLLKRLGGEGRALSAEQQRDVRAVRVLEQAGTPQAKKLLEALVKESPDWWVTREARAALERLSQRDKKP